MILHSDLVQAFASVELDRRDWLGLAVGIPGEDTALVEIARFQFAAIATSFSRRLEPGIEQRRRCAVIELSPTACHVGPKLAGLRLVLDERAKHRCYDRLTLQFRRLDREQLAKPMHEGVQIGIAKEIVDVIATQRR